MKKILISVLGTAALLSVQGCSKFLDVQPDGVYSVDNYFTNDQQSIDAVDKLYYYLQDEYCYSQNLHWEQCASLSIVPVRLGDSQSWKPNFILSYNGDTGEMPSMFTSTYSEISYANWIVSSLLKKAEGSGLTDIEKRSLGEAYFMRGYWHLLIAYRYGWEGNESQAGGVPFHRYEDLGVTSSNDIPPQQKSVMDNFKYIISDFSCAEPLLKDVNEYAESDKGRACKQSAVAMKARVYAYMATWDRSYWNNVIACVDSLENVYGRKLAPKFEDLFTEEPAEYFSDEYCWGYPTVGTGPRGGGVRFCGICLPEGLSAEVAGWGEFGTTADLYDAMLEDGEGNDRLVRSIASVGQSIVINGESVIMPPQSDFGYEGVSGYYINKWNKAIAHKDGLGTYIALGGFAAQTNCIFHFIRFADCLLLRAEAYLALGGSAAAAAADINKVRLRSVGKADALGNWTALYHERRCELAFEGEDWLYDLKRWALKGDSEIKALAIAELNACPQADIFEKDASGTYIFVNRQDFPLYYAERSNWADYKLVFPYPSSEVLNSAGKLAQNPGY